MQGGTLTENVEVIKDVVEQVESSRNNVYNTTEPVVVRRQNQFNSFELKNRFENPKYLSSFLNFFYRLWLVNISYIPEIKR